MGEQVPVLYGFYRSSAAFRVRIALAWKDIDYKLHSVNLHTGEQKSETYRKIVPTGKVPAFTTKDGEILSQSMAILEYIEEVYPENPLMPKDAYQRALVREISQIIACDIHPLQGITNTEAIAGDDLGKKKEWASAIISKTFVGLESRVKETSGKYSVGDSVTIADLFVLPMVVNAIIWGVDMTEFPTLTRLHETLLNLPAFKKAHPLSQEDCPEELRYK
ncbi:maleylacetoacetate isomerase [Backusella circina FSU 941]|nr:maleylacetoacetate isomerase [Backusella circina FSU 941]